MLLALSTGLCIWILAYDTFELEMGDIEISETVIMYTLTQNIRKYFLFLSVFSFAITANAIVLQCYNSRQLFHYRIPTRISHITTLITSRVRPKAVFTVFAETETS